MNKLNMSNLCVSTAKLERNGQLVVLHLKKIFFVCLLNKQLLSGWQSVVCRCVFGVLTYYCFAIGVDRTDFIIIFGYNNPITSLERSSLSEKRSFFVKEIAHSGFMFDFLCGGRIRFLIQELEVGDI